MRSLTALLVVAVLAAGCSTSSPLDGTWMLTSRELPDGTVQTAPTVTGCITFQDGMRNTNVYWEDESGNPVSVSSVAEYELTTGAYREVGLYYRESGMGGGDRYVVTRTTGRSPVERTDGRLMFKFPLHDEPMATFDGDRMTARREGAFVDHWRRID